MNIDFFRSQLKVDRHNLDEILETHSDLYERVSSQTALANSDMLRAKDALSRVEAELANRVREEQPGISIPKVAEAVQLHRDRRSAFAEWMRARERHEEWVGMEKAWKARGYSISTLAALFGAHYFTLNSTVGKRDRSMDNYDRLRDERKTTRRKVVE